MKFKILSIVFLFALLCAGICFAVFSTANWRGVWVFHLLTLVLGLFWLFFQAFAALLARLELPSPPHITRALGTMVFILIVFALSAVYLTIFRKNNNSPPTPTPTPRAGKTPKKTPKKHKFSKLDFCPRLKQL